MKKFALTLAMCLAGVYSTQAAQEEWVNRAVVNNPQVDATTVRNYGIMNLTPPEGYPYLFDNVQYFYNESSGLLRVGAPGLRLNYHNSLLGQEHANEAPLKLYQNEGVMIGGGRVSSGAAGSLLVPSFNIRAENVVDSGTTYVQDSAGSIDIRASESLDLWGAQYTVLGGNSSPLTATGNIAGANIRPGGVYPYAWAHDVQAYANVTRLGGGASVAGETPSGGSMQIAIGVPSVNSPEGEYQWWEDANAKVYVNETSYDPGDPKPLYQVVFVPGDSINYITDDAGNITGCDSYNQFRVTFGSAPYETLADVSYPLPSMAIPPFFPLGYEDKSGEHGAGSVIVSQYVYKGEDTQQGVRNPRYQQFYWEDLTGYFYDEMATNGFIMDVDGRGYIPDRFRVDTQDNPIDFRYFYRQVDGPYVDGPLEDGPLSLPLRYLVDENGWPVYADANTINVSPRVFIPVDPLTGEPQPAPGQTPMRVPTWTQELMGGVGPYMPEVGRSCLNGSLTQGIDDLKWLRGRAGHPYRIDPENPNNAFTDIDYSAYQISVGTNAFDKIRLLMDGSPTVGDKDSSDYPGHVTLTGGTGENVLDNMVVEAQQSVTLNITNLASAENVVLNANYVNAFFSRIKDENYPDRKLVLEEVVSPTMTRLQGNMAIYSGIYKVTFQICAEPYVRNPEPEPPAPEEPDPENPDAGGEEAEEEEEPEWEDAEFIFHLVYVGAANDPAAAFTIPTAFVDTVPMVDKFDVKTEVPVEITETMELGENFTFETPELTLRGTMSFPSTVTDEKIVDVNNFTNYAVLKSQGDNRLSGSSTNTFEESPAISLALGTAREQRFENFIHKGLLQFNEIQLSSDYLEFSGSGSSASYEGTTLMADKMRLYGGLARAGADININATDLELFDTTIEGGNAQLSKYLNSSVGISAGKIVLNVSGALDDGLNGTVDADGNEVSLPQNSISTRGSFEMPVKPQTGDLLNTTLEIRNIRVSRNVWAGEDRGDTLEGWTNNVALAKLTLSGSITGNESLRFDFAPAGGAATGALYVKDLYLGVRATADDIQLDYGKMLSYLARNGMKIYYVNCYLREELDYRTGAFRWVLCDKFPGENEALVQTKNHPVFGTQDLIVPPVTTAEMSFGIESAGSTLVENANGEILSVEDLCLRWSATAGVTYTVEVCDTLTGEWTSFYEATATENGEIVIPLEPATSQRFFRLIRSTL